MRDARRLPSESVLRVVPSKAGPAFVVGPQRLHAACVTASRALPPRQRRARRVEAQAGRLAQRQRGMPSPHGPAATWLRRALPL
jgi:hypothetical protein